MNNYEHVPVSAEQSTSKEWAPYFTSHTSSEFLPLLSESPRGDALTYGATPLDYLASLKQQGEVRSTLLRLMHNYPANFPIDVAMHIHTAFGKRFDGRANANNENFVTSLMYSRQDELEPCVQEMVERARKGEASPAEIILVRDRMGIRSAELACVTHPYGQNSDLLIDMRAAVAYAVSLYGGQYVDEPESVYKIKEPMGEEHDSVSLGLGVLVTRKRVRAYLPDGSVVKERSSFVLRTDDASGMPALLRAGVMSLDASDPEWTTKMHAIPGMNEYIETLLSQDESLQSSHSVDHVVPISTTVYVYNEQTAEHVRRHVEATAAREQELRKKDKERFQAVLNESDAQLSESVLQERKKEIQKIIEEELRMPIPMFGIGYGSARHRQAPMDHDEAERKLYE